MRLAPRPKPAALKSEQIILFRVGGALFAISSASVQEVKSVDSLAGAAAEIKNSGIKKVRHALERDDQTLFVVNGTMHFSLPLTPGTLVFILYETRTALLIDRIEKMTSMTHLQALPSAFSGPERLWYRGLTALDQTVVPVVSPDGFLTADELFLLDAAVAEKSALQNAAANALTPQGEPAK
jgi:chemotaxis signal transduction protein